MDLEDIYKFMKIFLIISTFFATFAISANPKVYFINLEDGDRVESPFLIQFGLSDMGIAPAGTDRANTGHHHLLINVNDIDLSKPIPSSSNHILLMIFFLLQNYLMLVSTCPICLRHWRGKQ